jgi:hypothetical protein
MVNSSRLKIIKQQNRLAITEEKVVAIGFEPTTEGSK